MKRTTIYLTDYQMQILSKFPNKEEITMAELIRRAIDEYIEKYKSKQQKLNEDK